MQIVYITVKYFSQICSCLCVLEDVKHDKSLFNSTHTQGKKDLGYSTSSINLSSAGIFSSFITSYKFSTPTLNFTINTSDELHDYVILSLLA